MSNSAGKSGQAAGNGGSASGISLSLAGRVALVTGNSTGLGKAIGLTLGRAGAVVPINYFNNDTRAGQAMAEYEAAGIQTMLVKADVTKPDDINDMIQQIETRFGSVDILVPNATCEQPQRPIEEYDLGILSIDDRLLSQESLFADSAHTTCDEGPAFRAHHQHHE